MEVAPFAPVQTDAWNSVQIIAAPADPRDAPDSYVFTVLSGDVTLIGSGNVRSFNAPAEFLGVTVQVKVQGVKGSTTSPGSIFTANITPWDKWVFDGTDWQPMAPVTQSPRTPEYQTARVDHSSVDLAVVP